MHRYEKQPLVITNVSSTSAVLSLRALRVSCFSLLFACLLPSVISRELYTMRPPVSFQWTSPLSAYVPRAYTAGSPKRLLVRYTIPSLFISAYVPSCVCVNSLALHVMRAFSHKLLSLLPLHSLWAQHNHHINPVHSIKETRTRGEKNPKGNMAR